jgi:hypothetical protein
MEKAPAPFGRGLFSWGGESDPIRSGPLNRIPAGVSGFLLHLLAAALHGHGAGRFALAAGASLLHGHFQTAQFAGKNIADFHFRAVRHGISFSFPVMV